MVDAASGEAVAGVRVILTQIPIVMGIRPSGGPMSDGFYDPTLMPATRPGNSASLTSEADGRFRAPLAPGRYYVRADRDGYVPMPGGINVLSLIPGESLKGITIKLNRLATVSGRVVSADGLALPHVRVQCLKWTMWGNSGRRVLLAQASSQTDEHGDYRITGVAPGQYLVAADAVAGRASVMLYAPGVLSLAEARTVEVISGDARSGVDVRLRAPPVFEVKGKVTGLPAADSPLMLMLRPRDPALQLLQTRQPVDPVTPDGGFIFRDIPPGEYLLSAETIAARNRPRLASQTAIAITDHAVGDIVLALGRGIAIQGQIKSDGEALVNGITLTFEPQSAPFSGSATAPVDAEGRFIALSLSRDVYRVIATGLPAGYYLQPMDTLDLNAAPPDVLVLHLQEGTAEVSGKVMDQAQKPLGDVQVIAVNQQGEIVRGAVTVIDGAYRLPELPPGEYRIFPVIDADLADPATLARLAAAAPKFTLAAAAHETRHLMVR